MTLGHGVDYGMCLLLSRYFLCNNEEEIMIDEEFRNKGMKNKY